MQLYHCFVPVQKYVQQGIQKNLSSVSMVTARMPVPMDTWCMLDSERDFRSLGKETDGTKLSNFTKDAMKKIYQIRHD